MRFLSGILTVCFMLSVGILLHSCGNEQTPEGKPQQLTTAETRCFLLAQNNDTTRVSLTVLGDSAYGTMEWLPDQKDGARGTLGGRKNDIGEWEFVYRYMIEGEEQSETKTMMIRGDALLIKSGELVDPAGNGNLCYKDASAARYSDTLHAVPCR
ncbi:MAG: hypothetical protein JNL32_09010 [Candidatus Kapabacteria bacterium]|nr:hypothetical protein [Candidatus Kapabacteria bacterium]